MEGYEQSDGGEGKQQWWPGGGVGDAKMTIPHSLCKGVRGEKEVTHRYISHQWYSFRNSDCACVCVCVCECVVLPPSPVKHNFIIHLKSFQGNAMGVSVSRIPGQL